MPTHDQLQPMSLDNSTEIRSSRLNAIFMLLSGLGLAAIAFSQEQSKALVLVGLIFAACSVIFMFDHNVKLLLTAEGLHDRRTESFWRWQDILQIRLRTKIRNAYVSQATLHINLLSHNGIQEVSIDVNDLDRTPDEILQLIEDFKSDYTAV